MDDAYKIEKNIPIPDEAFASKYAYKKTKYPFDRLEINDSFWVSNTKGKSPIHRYYVARKRHPDRTFLYAKEGDGIRFWRVA